nr:hypothetical protein [Tanacetum cinerariifolium]
MVLLKGSIVILLRQLNLFLVSADVPSVFWGEAVLTTTYVINRIPTAHNSSLSPFEKLYGTLPDYVLLRVFGCTCFVLKPHVERTKLSSNSTLCVFLGYGVSQKGYCCYDPVGKRAIGSRWVYKIKTKSDRSVKDIRLDMLLKNAFLNGDVNEEVYMKPPPSVPHQSSEFCKLQKALYGLKQAPRAWYAKFSPVVTSLGFVSSHHNFTLFVNRSSVGRISLSLYVDDMIITRGDCDGIELLKAELSHQFGMKDLGLLRYFLDDMIVDIPIDAKVKYTPTDDLHAYCDANWAGDSVTRKFTTRFCVFLGDLLISWKSKKQDILSKSSTEAKYRAMAVTTNCANVVFNERTKHIEIDCHFTHHHL